MTAALGGSCGRRDHGAGPIRAGSVETPGARKASRDMSLLDGHRRGGPRLWMEPGPRSRPQDEAPKSRLDRASAADTSDRHDR